MLSSHGDDAVSAAALLDDRRGSGFGGREAENGDEQVKGEDDGENED